MSYEELVRDIRASIEELAAGARYPDLLQAVDELAAAARREAFLLEHCVREDGGGWLEINFDTARQGKNHPAPDREGWIRGDIDDAIRRRAALSKPPQPGVNPPVQSKDSSK